MSHTIHVSTIILAKNRLGVVCFLHFDEAAFVWLFIFIYLFVQCTCNLTCCVFTFDIIDPPADYERIHFPRLAIIAKPHSF